jgi:hypothetical protein
MDEIIDYLMNNYYNVWPGRKEDIPTTDMIKAGLINHPEKFIIIRDDKIKGVAIFLTLSDNTYNALGCIDIDNELALIQLFAEKGDNVHFLLLAADSQRTILRGVKEIKNRLHPKSISWWNPETTRLHKYNTGD